MKQSNIIVGVSGKGRSLQNLLETQKTGGFRVAGVFSNKETCPGIAIAKQYKLPVFCQTFLADEDQSAFEAWLESLEPEMIVLAGFLKKFPAIRKISKHVINIHPALLPEFGGPGMYGINVHRAVKNAKVKETGATVHFVTKNYDEGQIISQIKVAVDENWTAEEIASNVFAKECLLLPKTIELLLKNKLPFSEKKVFFYDS